MGEGTILADVLVTILVHFPVGLLIGPLRGCWVVTRRLLVWCDSVGSPGFEG